MIDPTPTDRLALRGRAAALTFLASTLCFAGSDLAQLSKGALPNRASGSITTEVLPTQNLGLASGGPIQLEGDLTGFWVTEEGQGVDLDGDGLLTSWVYEVYDAQTGVIWNMADYDLAWGPLLLDDVALDFVAEAELGQDENGDGDLDDSVPVLFDFATSIRTVVPLAYAGRFVEGVGAILFNVDEQGQSADLNGDGDENDLVVHRLDLHTGVATDLGVSDATTTWIVGRSYDRHYGIVLRNEVMDETDLNGDGDTLDIVPALYSFDTGTLTSSHVAASTTPDAAAFRDGILAIAVAEASQGGTDLNGDGDTLDRVVHYLPVGASAAINLGFAATVSTPTSDAVLWSTDERAQHQDLNGDEDLADVIYFVHKISTQTTIQVGEALGVESGDGVVVHFFSESKSGSTQFTNNGVDDFVMRVLDVPSLATHDYASDWLAYSVAVFGDGRVVLALGEESYGIDFDRNGYLGDYVPAVIDPKTGSYQSVQTSIDPEGMYLLQFDGEHVVFPSWEWKVDVNGDGDHADYAVVAFDVRRNAATRKGRPTQLVREALGSTYFFWPLYWEGPLLGDFTLRDGRVALQQWEVDRRGGVRFDLNGDGDSIDCVVQLVELP